MADCGEGLMPASLSAILAGVAGAVLQCVCLLHAADVLVLHPFLCCACSVTRTLQEREAALKQHIDSSAEAASAVLQQLEEAKAAQQALKAQADKLEASQVCIDLTGWNGNLAPLADTDCGRTDCMHACLLAG